MSRLVQPVSPKGSLTSSCAGVEVHCGATFADRCPSMSTGVSARLGETLACDLYVAGVGRFQRGIGAAAGR